MELNGLERLIAAISPGFGVRRLSEKLALREASIAARGFDAARNDRRTKGWNASSGTANSEMQGALATVRNRSRDLVRNNEYAGNAKRKLVAHIVGAGIVPRAHSTLKQGTKERALSAWNAFAETCDPEGLTDIYGIQARAVGEAIEGGAAFIRWHFRGPEFGLKVPLQCEVLEHDFLDLQKNEATDTGVIVNGVEFDVHARRVAYWLFPVHPGAVATSWRMGNKWKSERVDAGLVDHIFRVDRPGQVTGVPWMAPIALRLRDIADYEAAELVRKKIEACLTVFVKKNGAAGQNLVDTTRQEKDAKGNRLEKVSPGLVSYLQEGEEIQTSVPAAVDGYADYLSQHLYAAAAGMGMPMHMFSGNLSGANYSSLREGKIDFWQVLDQWQWHWLVPQMVSKQWRRCMVAASGRGLGVSADVVAEFQVPKRPWVDPLKDVQAEEKELQMGLETWSSKVSARGFDPETQIEAITLERKLLDKAGISLKPAQQQQAEATAAATAAAATAKTASDEDDETTRELAAINVKLSGFLEQRASLSEPVTVNVHVPEIRVPDIHLPAPVINFEYRAPDIVIPEIKVPATVVNLPAPIIRMQAEPTRAMRHRVKLPGHTTETEILSTPFDDQQGD